MKRYGCSKVVLVAAAAVLAVSVCLVNEATAAATPQADRTPRMNVIFLDDGAVRVHTAARLRRNDWREWESRVPTFLGLLNKFVADFQRATGEQVQQRDSLFALEVAAGLSPEQKDKVIAEELERIFTTTDRPSSILARTTNGDDQLRLVFQDGKDYQPRHAAKFLRKFAEMSPAIAHSGIAQHFGPFQPPPTIIFDPREPALDSSPADPARARRRWGLVEEEAYLLPHYLLHHISLSNNATDQERRTFYTASTPEPGYISIMIGRPGEVYGAAQGMSKLTGKESQVVYVSQRPDGKFVVNSGPGLFWHRTFNSEAETKSYIDRAYQASGNKNFFLGFDSKTPAAAQDRFLPSNMNKNNVVVPYGGSGAEDTGRLLDRNNMRQSSTAWLFAQGTTLTPQDTAQLRWFGGVIDSRPTQGRLLQDQGSLPVTTVSRPVERVGKWPEIKEITIGSSGTLSREDVTKLQSSRDGKITGINPDGTTPGKSVALDISTSLKVMDVMRGGYGPGGILFDKKSIYRLDLTGRVSAEAQLALDAWRRGGGSFRSDGRESVSAGLRIPGMGRKTPSSQATAEPPPRLAGRLFALQLDLADHRNGSLPFALPRFLAAEADATAGFGGPWSFEPANVRGLEKVYPTRPSRPNSRGEVTVLPAETQTLLGYIPMLPASGGDTEATKAAPASMVFAATRSEFQPDLVARKDGGVDWVLEHGVVVEFSMAGLAQSVREPDGHTVAYVRNKDRRLAAQRASDGRTIQIDYRDDQPAAARVGSRTHLTYEYTGGLLRSVDGPGVPVSFDYDGKWLRSTSRGSRGLKLLHDSLDRLTSFMASQRTVNVQYVTARNAIRISEGVGAVDWRLGPRGDLIGVVLGNEAILWTRSVEGRIIQVAFGHLQDEAGKTTKKFIVDDTIGTAPKL